MKSNRPEKPLPPLYPSHEEEVITVAGAVAGATTGALAGPPGMAAGAAIGAAIGMVIGHALDREDERKHRRNETLDEEIGITSGDMGAPPSDRVDHGELDPVTEDDQALYDSLAPPAPTEPVAKDASPGAPAAEGAAKQTSSPGHRPA
jgi:hypothetical protein